jgi:hypothetical protein
MVFAEGFMFIGEPSSPPLGVSKPFITILKKAVSVSMVNITARDTIMSIPVFRKLDDVAMEIGKYPTMPFDKTNSLYPGYVKLTTGIDVPDSNVSH